MSIGIGTRTLAREGHCLLSHEPLKQRWSRLGIPRNIRPNLPAARASIASFVGCMEELPDAPDFICPLITVLLRHFVHPGLRYSRLLQPRQIWSANLCFFVL